MTQQQTQTRQLSDEDISKLIVGDGKDFAVYANSNIPAPEKRELFFKLKGFGLNDPQIIRLSFRYNHKTGKIFTLDPGYASTFRCVVVPLVGQKETYDIQLDELARELNVFPSDMIHKFVQYERGLGSIAWRKQDG